MKAHLAHCVVVASAFALSGCYTIYKGEHVHETAYCESEVQYTAKDISAVRLKAYNGNGGYRFFLEADGDFVAHSGQWRIERDKGEKAITFGVWPGYPSTYESVKGQYVAIQCLVAWWNPFTLGASLWSCFVSPFSDHYYDVMSPGLLSGSVFGCYKFIDSSKAERARRTFVEQSSKRAASVRLHNYRILFKGSEYNDEDGEFSLVGWSLKPGMRVKVKITSAPTLNKDAKDTFKELVGVDIETTLP